MAWATGTIEWAGWGRKRKVSSRRITLPPALHAAWIPRTQSPCHPRPDLPVSLRPSQQRPKCLPQPSILLKEDTLSGRFRGKGLASIKISGCLIKFLKISTTQGRKLITLLHVQHWVELNLYSIIFRVYHHHCHRHLHLYLRERCVSDWHYDMQL